MIFGLTLLGTFHTAISLIAVIAGFIALARYREISSTTFSGQVFLGAPSFRASQAWASSSVVGFVRRSIAICRHARFFLEPFLSFRPGHRRDSDTTSGGRTVPVESRRSEGPADHRRVLPAVPDRRHAAGSAYAPRLRADRPADRAHENEKRLSPASVSRQLFGAVRLHRPALASANGDLPQMR
jgi:hypothetical protein